MKGLEPVLYTASIPGNSVWTTVGPGGFPAQGRNVVMLGTESDPDLRFRFRDGATVVIDDAIDGVLNTGFMFHATQLILEFQNNGLMARDVSAQYTSHL